MTEVLTIVNERNRVDATFGLLSSDQKLVLRPHVEGRRVMDLGAGSGYLALLLAEELGAAKVIAVEQDALDIVHDRVEVLHERFTALERRALGTRTLGVDVAFLSWPWTNQSDALIGLLELAPVAVYLGRNTDGTACGNRPLFDHFRSREVRAYVPERRNSLIVYGGPVTGPRRLVGEEWAALQARMQTHETRAAYDAQERVG